KELPDLNAEKRIGVINKLGIYFKFASDKSENIGVANSLVVIARKVPSGGSKLNIDKKLAQPNMFTPKNIRY
ncbi:586_t:CDS:1, partial [Funneliformis geosporum]